MLAYRMGSFCQRSKLEIKRSDDQCMTALTTDARWSVYQMVLYSQTTMYVIAIVYYLANVIDINFVTRL